MPELISSIRSVAYVRMSTDRQRYSIENQLAFIQAYAVEHGFVVVRLYADEGHSGLRIDNRDALKNLIEEVQAGGCDFAAILVYDVSRWGRFQDCDESAFYEHICARAGVQVHYCAEPFKNDGTLAATLMKALKRAMAGEFSRELSFKVFSAHSLLAARGFRQGGTAGYGLRRQAVDEKRVGRTVYEFGERKAIQAYHVVLIPGPPDEVANVRRIYSLFVRKKYSAARIAKLLNEDGVPRRAKSAHWDWQAVMEILTNEKYVGCNIYNKTSKKLGAPEIKNRRTDWVVESNAFDPVVSPALFEKAQVIARKRRSYKNDELLLYLGALLKKFGFLSTRLIDAHADLGHPCSGTYLRRFGTLQNAFKQIGYEQPNRKELLKRVSEMALKGKPARRAEELKRMLYALKHKNSPRPIHP